jgi:hypothetical protein
MCGRKLLYVNSLKRVLDLLTSLGDPLTIVVDRCTCSRDLLTR